MERRVKREMSDKFDTKVRERRGRGPRRHEEERGRRRERIVLANWGMKKGRDFGESGLEVMDESMMGED